MHLRHIDPRSADWMDAMTDGDSDREGEKARPGGLATQDHIGERAGPDAMSAAASADIRVAVRDTKRKR